MPPSFNDSVVQCQQARRSTHLAVPWPLYSALMLLFPVVVLQLLTHRMNLQVRWSLKWKVEKIFTSSPKCTESVK